MYPGLRVLDICFTRPTDLTDIKFGDIIVYRSPESRRTIVHRVIGGDRENGTFLVKGDNVPRAGTESVPAANVTGKVVAVKRGAGRPRSLESPGKRAVAIGLSFLSRYDLTPNLFKKRFIAPALLSLSRSRGFALLRKKLYKNIFFSLSKRGNRLFVHAFAGKAPAAKAVLERREGHEVTAQVYVRYRNRDFYFVDKFLRKLCSVVDEHCGPDREIRITDSALRSIVEQGGDKTSYQKKIRFDHA